MVMLSSHDQPLAYPGRQAVQGSWGSNWAFVCFLWSSRGRPLLVLGWENRYNECLEKQVGFCFRHRPRHTERNWRKLCLCLSCHLSTRLGASCDKLDLSEIGSLTHRCTYPHWEVGVTWNMTELLPVAGSSGSLGLFSAFPRSTEAAGTASPDTLMPGTQCSTKGPVVAWAGLPFQGRGLL